MRNVSSLFVVDESVYEEVANDIVEFESSMAEVHIYVIKNFVCLLW